MSFLARRQAPLAATMAAAAVLGALLAGCGHSAPTAPVKATADAKPAAPAPSAAPATPGSSEAAKALIAKSQTTFEAMPAYHAKLRFFQKRGSQSAKGLYDLRGKKPRQLRIDIVEGGSAGTKLLWTGGSSVQVRAAGLLSAVTLTLPIDNSRLVSVRGYKLNQTDIPAIFTIMNDPANQVAVTADGQGVEVTGPKQLTGCVKTIVNFDPTTALPRAVYAYDAREMVFSMELPTFERKADVSLDL